MKHYRSSIPRAARERITATFATSPQKYKVECILNGKVVGIRYFHEGNNILDESGINTKGSFKILLRRRAGFVNVIALSKILGEQRAYHKTPIPPCLRQGPNS